MKIFALSAICKPKILKKYYYHPGILPMHNGAILETIGYLKPKTELINIPALLVLDQ